MTRIMCLGGTVVVLCLMGGWCPGVEQGIDRDAAKAEPLWPQGVPGSLGDSQADNPTLTFFPAPSEKANGAAVVVCPGGGYGGLAVDHEGYQVAAWLNSEGIAAILLQYRVAPYRHPVPLGDAQRAIRTVRTRAAEFSIDPARIGILGFSAGGHLASSTGTHFDNGDSANANPIEHASCRPDFMILIYPVITFKPPYAHRGSRKNLLGADPDPELGALLSNDEQVTPETPPTFLVHTSGDTGVPSENSVLFYLALRKAKVPSEMHIFEKGKHGFGLAPDDPVLSTWPRLCIAWLQARGLLG